MSTAEVFMHVSLTPELEARVKAKVESGSYNNASEVIREALRFMDAHEEWVQEVKIALLRKQIQVGVEQLENLRLLNLMKRETVWDK
ncbi:type II toxin-antitoxin system ParD family antitoxin [Oceanicoccus sp.]|uniref:type II toxin-antitoxin system ParD family antitoxin n=1 Tax=Oceanicoccus sp. TaxID=2691044 RepID=UPI00260763B3|nr:type II toxin-antitoxin system ParD family antitoxin [Oceanicoccus sp.]